MQLCNIFTYDKQILPSWPQDMVTFSSPQFSSYTPNLVLKITQPSILHTNNY